MWYPGATYHVMSRGNRRNAIFADTSDYIWFLEYMKKIKEKYPFKIHSICLMTNHFHMAIETGDDELWNIMQKVLSVYAEEYNHKYHYTGHLFEGRYVSRIIEDERYFLEVSRYIHLNPVKAQMVKSPLDYEYSSYGLFVNPPENRSGNKKRRAFALMTEIVETDRILDAFRHSSSEQYRGTFSG